MTNPPPSSIIGALDAFGANAAALVNPADFTGPDGQEELKAALPPLPAPTDFPATWRLEDRARFEWGNEVGPLVYRSVAASLSLTAGDPAAVNQDNLLAAANLLESLPPAPYPFDVNQRMAARGISGSTDARVPAVTRPTTRSFSFRTRQRPIRVAPRSSPSM